MKISTINLSEEQKNACNRLRIAVEQLRAIMSSPIESLAEQCKELAKHLQPINFESRIENEIKNWNKKRFYD
ncbi:hypothetical protein [Clostridium tagluense]|uniref:Uncharacterized protein n=1 Tax=Clostridium tagluense TaxID=360422 RepID=A0A401UUR4_9CLOT|nr:hypothetical protein [Clostridium tagluense]GCD13299.1 hypothetical protein Ctaglu_49220 [Clostridium tagluense]